MIKKLFIVISLFSCFPILTNCGSNDNIFSSAVKRSSKDKGSAALSNGDYNTAINELEKYLKEHPEDNQARSALVSAYLQKTGVDELSLLSKIAEAQGTSNKNSWQNIVAAMPEGNQQNVTNLKSAVDVLSAIPPEQRTEAQKQQLSIASASLAVTVVKQITDDGSGNNVASPEKIDAITEEQATLIVSSVKTSSENNVSSDGKKSGITDVNTKIQSQPGSTDLEKLKSYLNAQK